MLYQFNEKYVPYAGASITSLLENNQKIDAIDVYLLCEKVSKNSCNKLRIQIEKYCRKAIFLDTDELITKLKNLGINAYRGSYATNMKMFISDLLPEGVERLLYIDSDTAVVGDISELVNIDMNGRPIGMVLDSMCAWHKRSVGFSKYEEYYNGGVMLFDVERWRSMRCTERISDHIVNIRSQYMAPDQDLINIVLKGEIHRLDMRYNLQPLHVVYKYDHYNRYFKPTNYYSRNEIFEAKGNPCIIHYFRYLGEFPWDKNNQHPDKEYFDKYLAKSEWGDYVRTYPDHKEWVYEIERILHKILPKRLFIIIFKMSYEFYMWKTNKNMLNKHAEKLR